MTLPNDPSTPILSLTERSKALRRAPLDLLETHWQSLRKDGALPRRAQIDPRRIQDALEYAFVAEKVTSMNVRLRVAGTHLNDLAGMAVTGMPLASLFTTGGRLHLAQVLRDLFETPCMTRVELKSGASVWAGAMEGELLLLPCLDDGGEVTRVLGGLVTQGRIGRAPRRFDVTHVARTRLSAPGPGAAPVPTPRRPHLTLVVSND